MKCKLGKTGSLLAMLAVTSSFFLVELIVGYYTHSMALVADSFHMLSDVLALLVAFLSVRISKRASTINTFGWARAEILGALVNAVFLMALCFSIFVEAIDRFTTTEGIRDAKMVLIVGCVGLGVNLFGLLIFHQHSHGGHSHAGHDHGHGDHGHSHKEKKPKIVKNGKAASESRNGEVTQEELLLVRSRLSEDQIPMTENGDVHPVSSASNLPEPRIASSSQLNMRGVFLHVLGDALGSVVVIISALVVWYCPDWKYSVYIDPSMSIVLVLIISYTTFPLLRQSALILMQTVPTHIEIEDIRKRILEIEGVHAVHELHIWQLAGDRIIASAHIRCHNLQEYMRVAGKIKQFFHDVGIHSTTMQPEFEENCLHPEEDNQVQEMSNCIITCPTDARNCAESVCCRPTANGKLTVVVDPSANENLAEKARTLERVLHTDHPAAPSAPPVYSDAVDDLT